jgi:hypothetical protein
LRLPGDRPIRRVGRNLETEEYAPNGLTVDEAVRAIADAAEEWLYVFAPDGRQVARFRGTAHHVAVSDELAQRSGPLGLYGDPVMKDFVIVHNHPTGTGWATFPLSPSDLAFAVAHDLSRFIVITGQRRYELHRPEDGWPFDEVEVSDTVTELVDLLADRDGLAQHAQPDLGQLNRRVFQTVARTEVDPL